MKIPLKAVILWKENNGCSICSTVGYLQVYRDILHTLANFKSVVFYPLHVTLMNFLKAARRTQIKY